MNLRQDERSEGRSFDKPRFERSGSDRAERPSFDKPRSSDRDEAREFKPRGEFRCQEKDLKEEVLISLVLRDQTDLKDHLLTNHVLRTVMEIPEVSNQEENLHQEEKVEVLINLVQKEAAMRHVLSNRLLQTADTKSLLLKKKVISKR